VEVENKKVTKQSTKSKVAAKNESMTTVSKEEFERLSGKLDFILERFDCIAAELEMTNHI